MSFLLGFAFAMLLFDCPHQPKDSAMSYLLLGFLFVMLLRLVITTTPAKALENLREWKALIWPAPPPPPPAEG